VSVGGSIENNRRRRDGPTTSWPCPFATRSLVAAALSCCSGVAEPFGGDEQAARIHVVGHFLFDDRILPRRTDARADVRDDTRRAPRVASRHATFRPTRSCRGGWLYAGSSEPRPSRAAALCTTSPRSTPHLSVIPFVLGSAFAHAARGTP